MSTTAIPAAAKCLRAGEVVDLVGDVRREPRLRAEVLDERAEGPGGRIAPRDKQRLCRKLGQVNGFARGEPVPLG